MAEDTFYAELATGVIITCCNATRTPAVLSATACYDANHNQLPELILDIPFLNSKFLVTVERLPDATTEGDPGHA